MPACAGMTEDLTAHQIHTDGVLVDCSISFGTNCRALLFCPGVEVTTCPGPTEGMRKAVIVFWPAGLEMVNQRTGHRVRSCNHALLLHKVSRVSLRHDLIKIMVASEKGWPTQSMQQWNNLVAIFHPHPSDFIPNAPKMNLPGSEQLALSHHDVLIKNIHAARRRPSVFSLNATEANSIASAMAA